MPTLEERVQRLEDIEAIRRLKIRYAQLCDANYDPDGLAALFTEDAVFEGGALGNYNGREAIRQFMAGVSKQLTFAVHFMIGHMIDVAPSGTEATGSWYLLDAVTANGRADWIAVTYDDRYRKVDGQWLFSHVKVNFAFWTHFDTGWVKDPMVG